MPCRAFAFLVLAAMIAVFALVASTFKPAPQPKKHARSSYIAPSQ